MLAACGYGNASGIPKAGRPMAPSPTCSTDPEHGRNHWIDPTDGKVGSEVFKDRKAAALADAVKRNDLSQIRTFLNEGGDPNAVGDGGITLLDWALRRERTDAFSLLLNSGADPTKKGPGSRSVIHEAAIADDTTFLSMLIAHHADINLKTDEGETPLQLSLMPRCDKPFHMLIAAGADLRLTDPAGNTPLHTAAMINDFNGQLDLLEAGADPLARNSTGLTFQRYLNMTPESVLSDQGRVGIANIHAWLNDHHVPVEPRPKEEVMPWQRHD
jgi:ankyrin repeat protein